MNYFRQGLARSSVQLSDAIKKWPYQKLFQLLTCIVSNSKTILWLRNSFALNYWTFGLSDLDLSVWIEGGVVESLTSWKKIRSVKYLLIGGEVQIYCSEQVMHFINYANCWELRRDPELLKKINFIPQFNYEMELTVFLARSLVADKGLRRDSFNRQKKWQEHLKAFKFESLPMEVTWEYLVGVLSKREPFNSFARQDLEKAFDSKSDVLKLSGVVEKLIFSNHYVWGKEHLEQDLEILANGNESIHQFIYFQVCWEVWGLSPLTLVTNELNHLQLEGHIRNQKRLVEMLKITSTQRDWLHEGLDRLEKLYIPIKDMY